MKGVHLADLIKYAGLIGEIVAVFKQYESTPPGQEVGTPRVVFDIGHERWEIDPTKARRLR